MSDRMSDRPEKFVSPFTSDPQVRAMMVLSEQLDYMIGLLEGMSKGIVTVKKSGAETPAARPENPKGRPSSPGDGRSGEELTIYDFTDTIKVGVPGKGIAPKERGQGS